MHPNNFKIVLIHTGDPGNSVWERSLRVLGHGGGNTALGWVGAKAVGTPPTDAGDGVPGGFAGPRGRVQPSLVVSSEGRRDARTSRVQRKESKGVGSVQCDHTPCPLQPPRRATGLVSP